MIPHTLIEISVTLEEDYRNFSAYILDKSKYYCQLLHKRFFLKGVLKFTSKHLHHVSV